MASIHPFHDKRTYIDDGCDTELSSGVAPRTDGSLPKQAPRIPRRRDAASIAVLVIYVVALLAFIALLSAAIGGLK